MRILFWHGYLLGGTGSNVHTRELARVLSQLGHDVTVICQDPDPGLHDVGSATVVRYPLAGRLPVFVMDAYEGMEPQLLQDMTQAERQAFVDQAAESIKEQGPADILLTNHALMGAAVGAASGLPFGVFIHGSELEFSIADNAELSQWARECLDEAQAVLAVSHHIAQRLVDVVGASDYTSRISVVSPLIDTDYLRPEARELALQQLVEESRNDPPGSASDQRIPDVGNAARFEEFFASSGPTVLYVGKLSSEKGVGLLLEAMHQVNAQLPEARAIIVGFGPARQELESLAPLSTLFTGALEHRHLAHLWPLADVAVAPSTFPEAFGMVVAEAAACGCPPLVANQTGLREVGEKMAQEYPPHLQQLAAFRSGDVDDLADKLVQILSLTPTDKQLLSDAARTTVVTNWSPQATATNLVELFR